MNALSGWWILCTNQAPLWWEASDAIGAGPLDLLAGSMMNLGPFGAGLVIGMLTDFAGE